MTQGRSRSRAYPYLDLPSAVDCLRAAYPEGGRERVGRDELAARLGYAAGSGGVAARKIASLVHYGFVESHAGSATYSLSVRGRRVLDLDMGSEAFREAMLEAIRQPVLFDEVLACYETVDGLPDDLASVLEQHHGITARAATRAARVLRSSARFAGLLDGQHRLRPTTPGGGSGQAGVTSGVTGAPPDRAAGDESGESSGAPGLETVRYRILLAERRSAWLQIRLPSDVGAADFDAIEEKVRLELAALRTHFTRERTASREAEGPLDEGRGPGRGIQGVVTGDKR